MLYLFPLKSARLLEVKYDNNNYIKYLIFVRHCITEFICIILCSALDNSITPVSQMRKQRLKEIKNLPEAGQRLQVAPNICSPFLLLLYNQNFILGGNVVKKKLPFLASPEAR